MNRVKLRIKVKEVIESMFLSCPKEGQFSSDIIETLSLYYTFLYNKNSVTRWGWDRQEREYFEQTGVEYFISWMTSSHKDKIKKMPARSKAVYQAIAMKVCKDTNDKIKVHKLIGQDVVEYVSKHHAVFE